MTQVYRSWLRSFRVQLRKLQLMKAEQIDLIELLKNLTQKSQQEIADALAFKSMDKDLTRYANHVEEAIKRNRREPGYFAMTSIKSIMLEIFNCGRRIRK